MNPRRRRSNKHRRADRKLALLGGYSIREWAHGRAKTFIELYRRALIYRI